MPYGETAAQMCNLKYELFKLTAELCCVVAPYSRVGIPSESRQVRRLVDFLAQSRNMIQFTVPMSLSFNESLFIFSFDSA